MSHLPHTSPKWNPAVISFTNMLFLAKKVCSSSFSFSHIEGSALYFSFPFINLTQQVWNRSAQDLQLKEVFLNRLFSWMRCWEICYKNFPALLKQKDSTSFVILHPWGMEVVHQMKCTSHSSIAPCAVSEDASPISLQPMFKMPLMQLHSYSCSLS